MYPKEHKAWLLAAMIFAIGVVALLLPTIMPGPGYIVPNIGGDGGKNVYTFLYHVLYDKGFWFTGMNYPYGENIIYTDGQPLLSVALGYCKGITALQALRVMGGFIALSCFLAIVFLYRILTWHRVHPLAAMVFSGLIIAMSPQLFRVLGHYGLSYVCVIPMLFYWTIRYNERPGARYPVYIFLLGAIATFLHPYQSALILMWTVFYSIGYFLFTKTTIMARLRHLAPYAAAVLAILSLTAVVIRLTDPLKDRPITPFGFLTYCTRLSHVFASHFSPIWRMGERQFGFQVNRSYEEGFTYPGFTVLITVALSLLFCIGGFIFSYVKGRRRTARSANDFSPIWLFMAFAALLLAMGVPFVWHMERLVDHLSFLRQFRTLGRFSWIFYYIITVYGAVTLYRLFSWLTARGSKAIAWLVLIPAIALWAYEASGDMDRLHSEAAGSQRAYNAIMGIEGRNWPSFLAKQKLSASGFQALLVLGYTHVGSDKLWLNDEQMGAQMPVTLEVGLQLHLPTINAMMARSSWSITEKQVKIAGGPYARKPMLDELRDNRPFLLLVSDYYPIDENQDYLLHASVGIGRQDEWKVYVCYPDRIKSNDKKYTDSAMAIAAAMSAGDTCVGCNGSWYVNHFDTGNAAAAFFGKGGMPVIDQRVIPLADIPVRPAFDGQVYEFACWTLLSRKDYKNPDFLFDFMDANGNKIGTALTHTRQSTDNNGLWFRAVHFMPLPVKCARVICRVSNERGNAYEALDELMLRPVGSLIISKSADGKVMANDHLLAR